MNVRLIGFPVLLLLTLPAIRAQAPPSADLEGDVINSTTGAPIAGARLKLDRYQAEPIYVRSDVNGHFRFANLEPGGYSLTADSPGFFKAIVQVDLSRPRPAGNRGVSIGTSPNAAPAATVSKSTDADGTQHAKATLPLLPAAAISGNVTDPFGVPLADTQMELILKDPQSRLSHPGLTYSMQTRTDDRGEYRWGNLDAGTYYVVANKPGGIATWDSNYRMTYYGGATDLSPAKPLTLGPGEQGRADIQIVRKTGVHVAGRLIEPPGFEASTGSRVYTHVTLVPDKTPLFNPNGPLANGHDDYRLNDVLPGKYLLTAVSSTSADPFGASHKEVLGLIRPVEIGESDIDDLDLELLPLGDLAGTVTFSQGCTPAPLHITAVPIRGSIGVRSETTSDAAGRFVLHSLPTGRYVIALYQEIAHGALAVPSLSIQQGARDVQKDGFYAPSTGDEPLRIAVGCQNPGRAQ
jgi:hypothetical protein